MWPARKHNLRVVEDVVLSCGGTYKGKWVGTGATRLLASRPTRSWAAARAACYLDEERFWERANGLAECALGGRCALPRRAEAEILRHQLSPLRAGGGGDAAVTHAETVVRLRGQAPGAGGLKTYREITRSSERPDGEVGYRVRFSCKPSNWEPRS